MEKGRAHGPIPPTRWVKHLVRHLPAARAGDPEGVHELRSAIARLQVWLALGGWHLFKDDLRWLRRQAARARDLDVHLARHPPPMVRRHLREELMAAHAELASALDRRRVDGVLEAFALLPPAHRHGAARAVRQLARQALERGRRIRAHPNDTEALHALRRAVRRVRFAIEWQADRPKVMAKLQSALGDVADLAAALRHLAHPKLAAEGIVAYRRELEHELARHVRRAHRRWRPVRTLLKELT
jgi:CHAD domain-containing protein